MHFALTEEQAAIQETALTFAKERIAPHAAEWDENEPFPRRRDPRDGAARHGHHLCAGGQGRLGPLAHGRRADHGGAGLRLPGDLRLHLDPQHGGVDGGEVRLRRADRGVDAEARLHGMAVELLPDRAGRRLRCRGAQDLGQARRATTTSSTAPSSSSPAPAPPTSISCSRARATRAPAASRPSR